MVEVHDPTWFVDFGYADKNPFGLAGAPAQCRATLQKPVGSTTALSKVGEDFFNSLSASGSWGAQFATKVAVECP